MMKPRTQDEIDAQLPEPEGAAEETKIASDTRAEVGAPILQTGVRIEEVQQ